MIQQVVDFARSAGGTGHVVFLEDYEMTLARRLVQGVDVWLNTPRRPMEASGTSGMKAALNGVLNCSILDGWWAEGYTPERGLRDRRPRRTQPRRRSRTRRRRVALRRARAAGAAGVLRARRARAAGAVDRDDAPLDRRARDAVQHERAWCEYVERLYLPAHRSASPALEPLAPSTAGASPGQARNESVRIRTRVHCASA